MNMNMNKTSQIFDTFPTDCIHEISSFLKQSEFRIFYHTIHKFLSKEEQRCIKQLYLKYTFR